VLNLVKKIFDVSVAGFEVGGAIPSPFEKFFELGHTERKNLEAALKKSARIEATVSLGVGYSVCVNIAFFRKGKSGAIYEIHTVFSKKGCGFLGQSFPAGVKELE